MAEQKQLGSRAQHFQDEQSQKELAKETLTGLQSCAIHADT
jgi:hypothetical protein